MAGKTAAPEHSSNNPERQRAPQPAQKAPNPFLGLQQSLGNQAMLRLLESGAVQAKLRVSQPGDPDEREADRVAESVVSEAPRNPITPRRRSSPRIHRAPADAPAPGKADSPSQPAAKPAMHLVVEDEEKKVAPNQMRKSQFIALLRTEVCAAADAALASVGQTTHACPYIEKWLAFFAQQDSHHIERAMQKYAPETATARSAQEAIRIVVMRVHRAALEWARTGKVAGLPPELARMMPGQGGFFGAVRNFASTAVGGAILGFIGGPGKAAEDSESGAVMRKSRDGEAAPAHDAAAVKTQLGAGHSLDASVQSRMSSAFGYDFSPVRIHTDSSAASLSSSLNARAFTVGSDVAFASGEYKPGTPIGDTLIAHELAHVVQQGANGQSHQPMKKGSEDSSELEHDADLAAIGATALGWGSKKAFAAARNVAPRLRSGLRLQRCKSSSEGPAFTVVGHGVAQSTVKLAQERMTEILQGLKAPNVTALGKTSVELHIIPANKKLTDLPEFSHLKGVHTFDGRLYDDLRGAGGQKFGDTIRYATAEEQLVAVTGHDSGYAQGFVAGHETGHIVEQYALTKEQKDDLLKLYQERKTAGGPWLAPADYTKSNYEEYFAQGVAAYFGHPYSDADKDMYTRAWLKTNDPGLLGLLGKIFN